VREVLTQALLDAPMFGTRWRWNASIALAVKRNFNGRRAPAPFQRADAEDLLAVVFPDQLACAENLSAGYREIPDHPLVQQTVKDCLRETMDVEGLVALLERQQRGEVRIVCRDLAAPSPMAFEILGARPYAFLDDAPAEERRTLAVRQRSVLNAEEAAALGRLDAEAIAKVRAEAWPEPRTQDELHDALLVMSFLTAQEGETGQTEGLDFGWPRLFEELVAARRAARFRAPGGETLWIAAERLAWFRQLWPGIATDPAIDAIPDAAVADAAAALREILRGRLEGLGPVTAAALALPLGLDAAALEPALAVLQAEGFAMQGNYSGSSTVEWCERGLLARIHRYTLRRLRAEIEPVTPAAYYRFLLHWQHVAGEDIEGLEALAAVLEQLEGFPAAASAWEASLLPLRVAHYRADLLDRLCNAGRFVWTRLNPRPVSIQTDGSGRHAAPVRNTPITFVPRSHMKHWRALSHEADEEQLTSGAQSVLDTLREYGALFFADLEEASGLLHSQVETTLAELVARGLVTADTFAGLRALIAPQIRRSDTRRLRRRARAPGVEDAGRWSRVFQHGGNRGEATDGTHVAHIAGVLLRRYGVICRRVLEREPLLPPWRELLYAFRRMEARGEVRGGRFVQGVSGEQFALPEAVGALREARRNESAEQVMLSAADPLNLVGIITPGQRLPALPGNRILLVNGVPVALRSGKQVEFLQPVDAAGEWNVRRQLMGPFSPPAPAAREALR
jgi:ATP-dependent Lhr-like helicase